MQMEGVELQPPHPVDVRGEELRCEVAAAGVQHEAAHRVVGVVGRGAPRQCGPVGGGQQRLQQAAGPVVRARLGSRGDLHPVADRQPVRLALERGQGPP